MIFFTGDICLADKAFDIGFGLGSMIVGGFQPFKNIQKSDNDLWIGNFEAVVSDVSSKPDKKSFIIPTNSFKHCGNIIDYYGIANNHVMEHGEDAYKQMINTLNTYCKGTFGSKDHCSVSFCHQGKQVSVTGFSMRVDETRNEPLYCHVPELKDVERILNEIKGSDFKVAYVHWGVEYINYPSIEQRRFAHWLVDMGYDLVVGMHPHVMQGYEIYKGKFIFYSLGNFVFNMAYEPSKYSMIVKVDLENEKVDYLYSKIDKELHPAIIEEDNVPKDLRVSSLNAKVSTNMNVEKYVGQSKKGLKAYRKSNNKYIFKSLFRYNPLVFVKMIFGFVNRKFRNAR